MIETSASQAKQKEWHDQWTLLSDQEKFLFDDWIWPNTLETFRGKDVLEGGCGGGQHTSFVAPFARSVTAVDLNTTDIAKQRNASAKNVTFVEADLATMDLKQQFDVVFSIGVIHHTDSPDTSARNLIRHTKSGGRTIFWVYSDEGNFLVKHLVEPFRKLFLRNISRKSLNFISQIITALVYIPVYTVYLLPLRFLPYYEYFENFRKLSFYRNNLNVFDKLNAPQVQFITEARARSWMTDQEYKEIHVSSYKGVSWRISGIKR